MSFWSSCRARLSRRTKATTTGVEHLVALDHDGVAATSAPSASARAPRHGRGVGPRCRLGPVRRAEVGGGPDRPERRRLARWPVGRRCGRDGSGGRRCGRQDAGALDRLIGEGLGRRASAAGSVPHRTPLGRARRDGASPTSSSAGRRLVPGGTGLGPAVASKSLTDCLDVRSVARRGRGAAGSLVAGGDVIGQVVGSPWRGLAAGRLRRQAGLVLGPEQLVGDAGRRSGGRR